MNFRLRAVAVAAGILLSAAAVAAEPFVLVVMDPLSKPLSCDCVRGYALREYKWLIAGITVVVLAAGTVWTIRTPKVYEATTTVEYDPNPSRPLGGEVQDVADPIGNFWATREFFGTQNLVSAGPR